VFFSGKEEESPSNSPTPPAQTTDERLGSGMRVDLAASLPSPTPPASTQAPQPAPASGSQPPAPSHGDVLRQRNIEWLKNKRGRSPTKETPRKTAKVDNPQTATSALKDSSGDIEMTDTAPRASTGNPTMADVARAAPPIKYVDEWMKPIIYSDVHQYDRGGATRVAMSIQGVKNGKLISNKIIGDPWNLTKGYQLNITLDGGALGNPGIKITFHKLPGDKTISEADEEERKSLTVDWWPGVKSGDAYQINGFERIYGSNIEKAPPQVKEIFNLCPEKGSKENLVCVHLQTMGFTLSQIPDSSWFEGIPPTVFKNFNTLITGDAKNDILLWFIAPNKVPVKTYDDNVLVWFKRAVHQHIHPFAQYLDEDGKPIMDIEKTQPIKHIGRGMYQIKKAKNPKPKEEGEDEEEEPNFKTLPYQDHWKSLKEFHIFNGLGPIRDAQFVRGQHVDFSHSQHLMFLQEFPLVDGQDASRNERRVNERQVWAWVRVGRNRDGKKQDIPAEGNTVEVTFDNSIQGFKPHIEDERLRYTGTIMRAPEEDLTATQTDFRVLLTKPRDCPKKPASKTLRNLPDTNLHKAYIKVTFNNGPVKRELKAIEMMADENYQPATLGPIRVALATDPSKWRHVTDDLTRVGDTPEEQDASAARYNAIIERSNCEGNPSRRNVLDLPKRMRNKLAICEGPPGATKTTTASEISWGLLEAGHKIAFMAPSNAAVDHAALSAFKMYGRHKKMARLETLEEEKALLLRMERAEDLQGLDSSKTPKLKKQEETLNDARIHHALDNIVAEHSDYQRQYDRLMSQYNDHVTAVEEMRKASTGRENGLPLALRLQWWMFHQTLEDQARARTTYEEERDAIPDLPTRTEWESNHSVDDYDASTAYRRILREYIAHDGNLNLAGRVEFKEQRQNLVNRTNASMDILFMTLNNSGSDWIVESFKPTVLMIDEAAQAPIALLCVPLINFIGWRGCLLLGDTKQLPPVVQSTGLNEVIANSRQSAMGLLVHKGFPVSKLQMQYRMCPENAKFVSKHIYNDELFNHPSVEEPHPIRDACRKVALSEYGIKGETGSGNECVVVDVQFGSARVETGGTSLQNWANADSAINCFNKLIEAGVPAEQIAYLTYYRGQMAIAQQKVIKTSMPGGEIQEVKIFTTDAYQGQEIGVAIVDMVAASDQFDKLRLLQNGELGGKYHFAAVSAHVKNSNRLCVALSRAKYGQFVFCQLALLFSTFQKGKGKRQNIAYWLAQDAIDRKIVFHDRTHLDTHSAGVQQRLTWDKAKLSQELKQAEQKRLAFIGKRLRRQHEVTHTSAPAPAPAPAPIHKTPDGLTTRPIGPAEVTKAADAYDRLQGKGPQMVVSAPKQNDFFVSFAEAFAQAADEDEDEEMVDIHAMDRNPERSQPRPRQQPQQGPLHQQQQPPQQGPLHQQQQPPQQGPHHQQQQPPQQGPLHQHQQQQQQQAQQGPPHHQHQQPQQGPLHHQHQRPPQQGPHHQQQQRPPPHQPGRGYKPKRGGGQDRGGYDGGGYDRGGYDRGGQDRGGYDGQGRGGRRGGYGGGEGSWSQDWRRDG